MCPWHPRADSGSLVGGARAKKVQGMVSACWSVARPRGGKLRIYGDPGVSICPLVVRLIPGLLLAHQWMGPGLGAVRGSRSPKAASVLTLGLRPPSTDANTLVGGVRSQFSELESGFQTRACRHPCPQGRMSFQK